MRIDWVPFSAAALVTGAVALAVGALLMPTTGGSAESLRMVQQQDGRWLGVAVLYFVAAVAMTLGLPSILTLITPRVAFHGLVALGVFAVGCIGTAGYAMLLAFFRALVLADSIESRGLDELTQDAGLGAFLYGWVAAFYLGEVLLALALLRAGTVQRWLPLLLLAHVAAFPLAPLLPESVGGATVLMASIAFAGIGIRAAEAAPAARVA